MNFFIVSFRYKLVLSYETHFFSETCWFLKYFSTDQWLGSTKFLSYFDIFLYKYVIVFPETNILRILVNDNKWRHMIMARRQYWPATGQYRKLGMGSVIDGKFSVYQEYNTGMHKNIKFYEILKLWLFQLGTFPCKVTLILLCPFHIFNCVRVSLCITCRGVSNENRIGKKGKVGTYWGI